MNRRGFLRNASLVALGAGLSFTYEADGVELTSITHPPMGLLIEEGEFLIEELRLGPEHLETLEIEVKS